MLYSLSADPHCLWRTIELSFHRLDDRLMFAEFPGMEQHEAVGRLFNIHGNWRVKAAGTALGCEAITEAARLNVAVEPHAHE